ncbi:2-amino-3-ketobutyrate coenzyme A ligase, mitochondrial-like [Glandiceps talaboti]
MACENGITSIAATSKSDSIVKAYGAKTAVDVMNEIIAENLSGFKEAGIWKAEKVISAKQGVAMQVEGTQNRIINFCSNDYFALSSHPEVIDATAAALYKYGTGNGAARFMCGTRDIHKELEKKISEFHNRDDAIVYTTGFHANIGIFEALLTHDDAVFSDEFSHSSIITGINLCNAQKHHYKHRDMKDLEEKLSSSNARIKLIATDGVFSLDGTFAPLKEVCDLADEYGALVFVDDAHGTGCVGDTGRGTEEYLNVQGRPHIINSALSKALGGTLGGYTTGPKALIDFLRQKSKPYLCSTGLPSPTVAGALQVFDILGRDSYRSLRDKITANAKRFRDKMTTAGFTITGGGHPICPIILEDDTLAHKFADEMFNRGIYVGAGYPTSQRGKASIRVSMSTAHSEEDIDSAVDTFISVGKNLEVI